MAPDDGDLVHAQRDAGHLAQEPLVPLAADRDRGRELGQAAREPPAELLQGAAGRGRGRGELRGGGARDRVGPGQGLRAGLDAGRDAVELGHGELGELPGRPAQRGRGVGQGGRDGAEQPRHLGDPGRVHARPQQRVEDRPERLVGPEPGDAANPEDVALPPHPGYRRPQQAVVNPVWHRVLVRADPGQLGLERAELVAALHRQGGLDLRTPPRGPVEARDVVPGPGLLAGAPGPEPLAQLIKLLHRASLP